MKVVFRADASLEIGTGHIMRCLTLARALIERGGSAEFICREHKGNLIEWIQEQGFKVHRLPLVSMVDESSVSGALFHASWLGGTQEEDAELCEPVLKEMQPNWLIVDHYAIDHVWQTALKSTYEKLMVVDDLGDRRHVCNLLLDQNYGSTQEKYRSLVPDDCTVLTGTDYSLLRPEFAKWRAYSLKRRQNFEMKNLLITLGGVDNDNFTGRILQTLRLSKLPSNLRIKVVMGATAPNLELVRGVARNMPVFTEVCVNVNKMAEVMANADLAIGAAGATSWERCCLGLPTIQMVIAENQRSIAESLVKTNAIKLLSDLNELSVLLDTATDWMKQVSQNSAQICDGLGAQRVLGQLLDRKE